jgi:hypothetical protein
MAVTIQSATFGDERSNTDVTATLAELIKSKGGIDVPVNSSLVPVFGSGTSVKLTDQEVRDADTQAEKACGGSSDQVCMELKRQEFQAQRLQEKRMEDNRVENIIKGRRLRVKYIDENKRVQVVDVPEGQTFKLGTPTKAAPFKLDTSQFSFSLGGTVLEVLKWLAVAVATFFYAFSILVTYRSFIQAGYKILTYVATAAAVLIPYSGYFIVLAFFGLDEYVKNLPVKNNA